MSLFLLEDISDNLLADLDKRDVALWLHKVSEKEIDSETWSKFVGLPWRLVLSEGLSSKILEEINNEVSADTPFVQKRGFIQIINDDPSRLELPPRCLPIYLLDGGSRRPSNDFQDRLRRMTMLEELRRSGVRQVLILSGDQSPVPPALDDLTASGFKPFITFVSESPNSQPILKEWIAHNDSRSPALISASIADLVVNLPARYLRKYPEDRTIVRIRDRGGRLVQLDVTGLDDPERPLLDWYSVIEERDLATLSPEQLSEEDFVSFFKNTESSWRPYAAGLPWQRQDKWRNSFANALKKLDSVGPEENCVAYVVAEPGAGGTTFIRTLAWNAARDGYPVLVAKQLPFTPDALSVANYFNRVRLEYEKKIQSVDTRDAESTNGHSEFPPEIKRYEVPWLIVFDRVHWQYRDGELRRFRNEMEKRGRPVCILVISKPVRELAYFDSSVFKQVGELNHVIDQQEVLQLGRHLNQFLKFYRKPLEDWQWSEFYREHTISFLEGQSVFWVALSFWIRGQYDLSETIQQRLYKTFLEIVEGSPMQDAILEIAALSSERLPLPDGLLPASQSKWPISHIIEDHRSELGSLGLIRVSTSERNYWALAHDILGRLIVNALFNDPLMRDKLGFSSATDPEHLRFMLLRKISKKQALGEREYRSIGEDFATFIFKIDPDHDHANFAPYWREVLEALDSMAQPLRDTSRVFRHHTAVSRRRVAKLNPTIYGISEEDKISLLNRAIDDIKYALTSIDYTAGSEPDLNLYNSLSHAYHDLADAEEERNDAPNRVDDLRRLAQDAARRAYELSPSNSFVVETYVRDLLSRAKTSKESSIEHAIEALGILFSAISSNEESYRKAHLGDLADKALDVLLNQTTARTDLAEPTNPLAVLTSAWRELAQNVDRRSGTALSDLPESNRVRAIEKLGHPAGQGNMQVVRLNYELTGITYSQDFKKQLELLEQLQHSGYRTSPQLRLEYGILLYQTNRSTEGDSVFRNLRKLWRQSEHFVNVPSRLRWLKDSDTNAIRTVHAVVGSDRDLRSMARISEFNNILVPFRAEEFGLHDARPGVRFSCLVSFGHNGPFLRPVTARTT